MKKSNFILLLFFSFTFIISCKKDDEISSEKEKKSEKVENMFEAILGTWEVTSYFDGDTIKKPGESTDRFHEVYDGTNNLVEVCLNKTHINTTMDNIYFGFSDLFYHQSYKYTWATYSYDNPFTKDINQDCDTSGKTTIASGIEIDDDRTVIHSTQIINEGLYYTLKSDINDEDYLFYLKIEFINNTTIKVYTADIEYRPLSLISDPSTLNYSFRFEAKKTSTNLDLTKLERDPDNIKNSTEFKNIYGTWEVTSAHNDENIIKPGDSEDVFYLIYDNTTEEEVEVCLNKPSENYTLENIYLGFGISNYYESGHYTSYEYTYDNPFTENINQTCDTSGKTKGDVETVYDDFKSNFYVPKLIDGNLYYFSHEDEGYYYKKIEFINDNKIKVYSPIDDNLTYYVEDPSTLSYSLEYEATKIESTVNLTKLERDD